MQNNFTESIFYQIELTAKYCKLLGQQVFEKFEAGISIEEFSVLSVLKNNSRLCQRDVAKLILKDRANTGKLLDVLTKKGLISRKLSVKNNRPVKFVKITEEGLKTYENVTKRISPHFTLVKEKIKNSDLIKVVDLLKELRQILDESLEIQI